MPGDRAHVVRPRERRLNLGNPGPRGTRAPAFRAPRHAEKLKSQVRVWGATGEGRVLGRIFCFVFFMTIYNFAFLPSAPASLAPRCVPH